jgi:ubiquinone/menaquinone biosynthesis C-methylase UbiE
MSYYDDIAAGYNELHGEEQRKKYALIASHLKLGTHVLDVGAGTGIGHDIIPSLGIDPAPKLIKQHPNKESIVGSAEALPFPDKSFDAVICVTAIHHTDYRKAISEMRRVTKGPIAVTILKKSPQSAHILAYVLATLTPLTLLDEEKDYVCIHDPSKSIKSE